MVARERTIQQADVAVRVVQALVDGRRLVLAGKRREGSALYAQRRQAQRLILRITCK